MQITKEWLEEHHACDCGIYWFCEQKDTDCFVVLDKLIEEDKLYYVNWFLARALYLNNKRKYEIFAAELVLHITEKNEKLNKIAKEAIQAAKDVLVNDSEENKKKADAYAYAAYVAADVAAYAAAYAADVAAYAARKEIQIKIINYGIELLKQQNELC